VSVLEKYADNAQVKTVTLIKRLAVFPSSAGMSLNKLSLGGNNFMIPGQREFG
jgi:hypothetical protein